MEAAFMNKILNRAEQEQQLEQQKNLEVKPKEKEDKNVYSDLVQALRVKK